MATLALVQHNLMCLSLVKNVISHKSITIQRNTGSISVNIGNLKHGKYGLRVEGIIDPKTMEADLTLMFVHSVLLI